MKPWIAKNQDKLRDRFPKLSTKVLPHFTALTTSSFSLGVAEEFVLISVITIGTYLTDRFYLWIGLLIAFTIHLIIHFVQFFILRKYIPVIVTSAICMPVCICIIAAFLHLYPVNTGDLVGFGIYRFISYKD